MRSSKVTRRGGQSGQSLVEALVASAVLGLGVVTALTALDTMVGGAKEATGQAWATCAVRAEAGILEAASWQDEHNIAAYPVPSGDVKVTLSPASPGNGQLEVLDVTATDPGSRATTTATVMKAKALSGGAPPAGGSFTSPVAWCSYVTRPAP
jgi:hypothetical protein